MGDGSFNGENPYGAQKPSRKSKALNILAIFLGITIIFAPIGLIIGIVQLVKNKSSEKKGLSIASTAISGVMTLFVVLAVALGSQTSSDNTTPETATTTETEETTDSKEAAAEKTSKDKISEIASYENYTLTLKDASSAVQEDGTNVIHVNAVFKNDSAVGTYAYSAFSVKAYQNGEELLDASDFNGSEANLIKEVKDGATENVAYSFQLNDSSDVEIDICEPTADANKIGTKTYPVKIETAKVDTVDSDSEQTDASNSTETTDAQAPSSTKDESTSQSTTSAQNKSSAASAAAGAVAGATVQKAADQQATAQKAAEQKAAEQKAAEQKAAEQKATEQKAAEQKAAEQKAAEQKAAEQKVAEQKAAEQKAAEQKAAEQKAAEQKAAEQKAAEQNATGQNTTPSAPVAAGTTYVVNTHSGKFHRPDCSSVKDIAAKNRLDYKGDRQSLIDQKYVPCKRCNP